MYYTYYAEAWEQSGRWMAWECCRHMYSLASTRILTETILQIIVQRQ